LPTTSTRAAAGQGTDAGKLDDKERAHLRKLARDWLRADLSAWAKLVESGPAGDRPTARQTLAVWQKDADLASVRDTELLNKLPGYERDAWRQLWADVEALRK
jgi:hypothetical protein